jgi:hypothetical protein
LQIYSEKELSSVIYPTPLSGVFLLCRIATSTLVRHILEICWFLTSVFFGAKFCTTMTQKQISVRRIQMILWSENMPKLPYFEGKKGLQLPNWLLKFGSFLLWIRSPPNSQNWKKNRKNHASNHLNIATQYVVVEPLFRSK